MMENPSDRNCPCYTDPLRSKCGQWEGNESLCVCADYGLVAIGDPAPS